MKGFQHAPKFRSAVLVDGSKFTSTLTFPQLKEAEQDVAKLALDYIRKRMKNEGSPLIHQDPLFCKSILYEFAVKMKLDVPRYKTARAEGPRSVFVSSLVFHGKTYTGDVGGSKKAAEQLAARAAIQSLLGSDSGAILNQIIKSKYRRLASLSKWMVDSGCSQSLSTAPVQPAEDCTRQLHIIPPSTVDPGFGEKRRFEPKKWEPNKKRI